MDELLAVTHAHLRPAAMKYLAVLDPHSHKLCMFAQEICESMTSTCKFLKACRVKVGDALSPILGNAWVFLPKMVLQVVSDMTFIM